MDGPDLRVPGYLGRVLSGDGLPIGTCFQLTPGVFATAWHVLNDLDAAVVGAGVRVDALGGGRAGFDAQVARLDALHDLAVVRSADALPASVAGLVAADDLPLSTAVVVTGVAAVDDPGHDYRHIDATGSWQGGTTRDEQTALGRMEVSGLLKGMSGGPVRRQSDDWVVGVVSGRYNSLDGWLRDSGWVARSEDLRRLLAGVTVIELHTRLRLDTAADLTLTISDEQVRLVGAGREVTGRHGEMTAGLDNAVDDVRRARAQPAARDLTGDPPGAARGVTAGLARVGELLAQSFLPAGVCAAAGEILREADRQHLPVRVGVAAGGSWARLPWEALPDPVDRRPLALHPLITSYRRVAAAGQPASSAGPLQILIAIAAPDVGDGELLDYERELRDILAAVQPARQAAAQVRILPFATLAGLRAALQQAPVHVLHLSGHGRPGQLVLEHDDGSPRPVTATELVEGAVPAGRMPPVIALAACHTDVAADPQLPSFAAELLGHGASVVIGTETTVSDRYATALFARIYGALADTATPNVLAAVAEARRLVHQQLATSPDERDRQLASRQEWAVVTVLAGQPTVPVLDATLPAQPRPEAVRARLRGLLDRGVGDFVGRRRELRRWPDQLLDRSLAGLVVVGIGGVGKTALASELLGRLYDRDPTRLTVALTGPVRLDELFGRISRAIRQRLRDSAEQVGWELGELARVDLAWPDRLDILLELLAGLADQLRLLVVFDNFEDNLTPPLPQHGTNRWQLRDPGLAELLAGWLDQIGASRLLITSRYPFTLPGDADQVLSFRPIGPLSFAETRKLAWSLPALDQLTNPELDQVWRRVGGHPRSLEYLDALLSGRRVKYVDADRRLTAALERSLTGEQRRQLHASPQLDTALAATVTLAADDVLLASQLDQLDPPAQQLLFGAAVYREPVDANALLFQLGAPDPSAAAAEWGQATQRVNQLLADQQVSDLAALDLPAVPAAQQQRLAADRRRLAAGPPPPRRTDVDLDQLVAACAATSLLYADPNSTVFVHRWTAAELERHWAARHGPPAVHEAHRRAAGYWQWRADAWPQDRQADIHDLLEARYHLIRGGDPTTAGRVTEGICSQLDTWGAWDQEASLVVDTLTLQPEDFPQRPAWIHQLGILAQHRGDYAEAERRYRQALDIFERLGDQADMATSYHQLGRLAQHRGDYAEAERRYRQALDINDRLGNQAGMAPILSQIGILLTVTGHPQKAVPNNLQSLAIRQRLGSPQVAVDLRALLLQRQQLGDSQFTRVLHEHLDEASVGALLALLDQSTTD